MVNNYTVAIAINNGEGTAIINDGQMAVGKMELSLSDKELTVHHTEINEDQEGKGLAKILLNEVVAYARTNELKILPLCIYVLTQFKRHSEEYSDIWKKK